MKPQTIGRALGIGVRVAGRIAGQQLAAHAPSSASTHQAQSAQPGIVIQNPVAGRSAAQITAQASRGVSQGVGGFLRSFRRVGGILWLEVTGAFFLLFAAAFAIRLWQNWAGFGKVSRNFTVCAVAVFLYLGVSAFWRARRR